MRSSGFAQRSYYNGLLHASIQGVYCFSSSWSVMSACHEKQWARSLLVKIQCGAHWARPLNLDMWTSIQGTELILQTKSRVLSKCLSFSVSNAPCYIYCIATNNLAALHHTPHQWPTALSPKDAVSDHHHSSLGHTPAAQPSHRCNFATNLQTELTFCAIARLIEYTQT